MEPQTVEEMEAEIERTKQAIETIQRLMANKALWEDLQVSAWELNDAIEDLNDEIKRTEAIFRDLKLRPGWVHVGDLAVLSWNGQNIIFEREGSSGNLTSAAKAVRMLSVDFLPDLYEELTRERLKPADPGRIPKWYESSRHPRRTISSSRSGGPRKTQGSS